jgi:hypothetical protein
MSDSGMKSRKRLTIVYELVFGIRVYKGFYEWVSSIARSSFDYALTGCLHDPCEYITTPIVIKRYGFYFTLFPGGSIYDALIDKAEPLTFDTIRGLKGGLFVDVGAGEGGYTIMLSNNYKKIIAVEPNPARSARLSQNILLNHITNVDICRVRLSDKAERSAQTLDDLVPKNTIIDLLKIDVDGPELSVLKGGQDCLRRTNVLMVEVRKSTETAELELMHSVGFTGLQLDRLVPDQGEQSVNMLFIHGK